MTTEKDPAEMSPREFDEWMYRQTQAGDARIKAEKKAAAQKPAPEPSELAKLSDSDFQQFAEAVGAGISGSRWENPLSQARKAPKNE